MGEQLVSFEVAKLAKEKYKGGDKHPTDEKLIFYQYNHPYFKDTNGGGVVLLFRQNNL